MEEVWKEFVLQKDRDIDRHRNGMSIGEDGDDIIWYDKEVT